MVAKVIGRPVTTLHTWRETHHVPKRPAPGKQGVGYEYDLRDVCRLALTSHLVAGGLDIKKVWSDELQLIVEAILEDVAGVKTGFPAFSPYLAVDLAGKNWVHCGPGTPAQEIMDTRPAMALINVRLIITDALAKLGITLSPTKEESK